MSKNETAERIYKLVYGALVGSVPNLEGHFGLHGMMKGLNEDLMKQTAVICGKINSSSLTEADANNYLALCKTAVATGILAESDLDKIEKGIEGSL